VFTLYKLYFITRNTSLQLHQAFVIFEYAFSAQAVLEVVFMRVRLGNFHAGCLKVGAIDFQWPLFARRTLKLSAILFHRHKGCRMRD